MFSLIACIGQNRELGQNNQLIFHIKDDMKFFRATTLGHKVVMGRKTWESLPAKLKDRENIVISRQALTGPDLVVHDVKQFILNHQATAEEIFIIGGGTIYATFLPYATHLYLTEVSTTIPTADTFFPDFKKSDYSHKLIKKGKEHDLDYSIIQYTKLN
ncbi:dihydrofolate reductase [Candidatus Saccharibacteria bacterium]|nr:dihydrofolate reductase [Candidatus Saccharibacteria bacterium]